ncbi:MAG: pilus assembly protein PilM [Candidatus Omnitrophica bacterium]|nr:pilus assembly protein PilM [Candidatus Omnitrophota bacterium]
MLGIYLGSKSIQVVEVDGLKLTNAFKVSSTQLGNLEEEKVSYEIKLVNALKDELRKAQIEAKDVVLTLLGRDLIIRTFYMPVLPANEMMNAVRFEAKKYIPFKMEEVVYDYQLYLDKINRKYLVLFVGIKKELLERYQAIMKQLGLTLKAVEYAGFSMFRFLKLGKIKNRGITGVVNVDLVEEDEVNFIVLENDFPVFCRDILLSSEVSAENKSVSSANINENLEKLKVELRMSIDFYLRKFPTKNISMCSCIAPEDIRQGLKEFLVERGIQVGIFDANKLLGKPVNFSLSLLKAYAAAVINNVPTEPQINLLPTKIKTKVQTASLQAAVFEPTILIRNFLIVFLIILLPFLYYLVYKIKPMKEQLASIKSQRPNVVSISAEQAIEELSSANKNLINKYQEILALLKNRLLVTEKLEALPNVLVDGVWLKELKLFQKDGLVNLVISGSAYLGNEDAEQSAINQFVNNLSANEKIGKFFQPMPAVSMNRAVVENTPITDFTIEYRSK